MPRDLTSRCSIVLDVLFVAVTITLLCDHPRDTPDEHCHRFLVAQLVENLVEKTELQD